MVEVKKGESNQPSQELPNSHTCWQEEQKAFGRQFGQSALSGNCLLT